jgi:hypothetical protein
MSVLNKLKIVALPQKSGLTPEQQRRGKVIAKLQEQLKLAEAALGGPAYERQRWGWGTDENGEKIKVPRPIRIKTWWDETPAGAVQFGLRYGSAPLEIQKGKTAVEVGKLEELPGVIRALMQAIAEGELDAAIKAVADTRGPKGKQRKAA